MNARAVADGCRRRELSASGSTAFAQNEPSVEPLAAPAAAASAAISALVLSTGPPPQPYGAYPRGPARLRYEEGDPIPAGYHVVNRSRQGLVIAGTIVFAVSYGIALSVAMIDDFKDRHGLARDPDRRPVVDDVQPLAAQLRQPDRQRLRRAGSRDDPALLPGHRRRGSGGGRGMLGFGMAGRQLLVRDDSYAYVRLVPTPVGSSGYGATLLGLF